MIREHRSREKLEAYYKKFIEEGTVDPNVHPWVAESWQKSRELGIDTESMNTKNHLARESFVVLQQKNKNAIEYLEKLIKDNNAKLENIHRYSDYEDRRLLNVLKEMKTSNFEFEKIDIDKTIYHETIILK